MSLIDRFIERNSNRPPDFVIRGGRAEDDPAVYRWWIIPRNRFFNVYLHKFMQDDDQVLHDHPWPSLTLILKHGYSERQFVTMPVDGQPLPETVLIRRAVFKPVFRPATTAHQVVVDKGFNGETFHSWSLFFTGPKYRMWGFWCPGNGKAHWKPYLEYSADGNAYGTTGKGCEDGES